MRGPLRQTIEETIRVLEGGKTAGVALRAAGGTAVALRCPSTVTPALHREYADVDVVGRRKDRSRIVSVMVSLGYETDLEFNALHGARRLLFWDRGNDRQADVFLERVDMCHTIELSRRLCLDHQTLTLADLLLMKIQIVETNRKDFLDITALLADHGLTDDDSGINAAYIAHTMATDWGLWRTGTSTLRRAANFAEELEGFVGRAEVQTRITELLTRLDGWPKSRRWRFRSILGERLRWYELPEEVG